MTDTLQLTPDQHTIIERALLTVDRMREFLPLCDKANLFQLTALYRRMAVDLEETIQLQLNAIRFNRFPKHWGTEAKLALLREPKP